MMTETHAAAAQVQRDHREACFDAIREALHLGDTKGDTGLWLDWIESVATGRSLQDVVKLTIIYGFTAEHPPSLPDACPVCGARWSCAHGNAND